MSNQLLTFLLLLLLVACQSPTPQNDPPQFIPSSEVPIPVKAGQQYQFGYLQVPENRSVKDSRSIQLPVYIFKSRSPQPQQDPIIYLVGGPGSSVMRAVPYMNYYRYLDDRDFILFEQRGTAYAQPHLACPEWAQATHQSLLTNRSMVAIDSLYYAAAKDCRDRLRSEGIDLNGYTTREIAADVADLAQALQLSSYNILSTSYGTKIAQVLMRDHPQGLRSVVMDSPLPLEVSWEEESPRNLLAAYEQLFKDCEEVEPCRGAFPKLKERFFDFLATQTPLDLELNPPQIAQSINFRLRGQDLLDLFYPGTSGAIHKAPMRIDQLVKGDYTYLRQLLENRASRLGDGQGKGMRMSVWCAEEAPFVDYKQTVNRDLPALGDWSMVEFDSTVCSIWGVRAEPPRENQAVRSAIPTLLISGEYDPVTPPIWARQMQERLSNSHQLIFTGWQHTPTTYWDNPCGMEAAHQFFNQPQQLPALDCLDQIGTVSFQLAEEER